MGYDTVYALNEMHDTLGISTLFVGLKRGLADVALQTF